MSLQRGGDPELVGEHAPVDLTGHHTGGRDEHESGEGSPTAQASAWRSFGSSLLAVGGQEKAMYSRSLDQ